VLWEIVRQHGGKVLALFDNAPPTEHILPGIEIFLGLPAYHAWLQQQIDVEDICAIAAIGGARGSDRREFLELFRKSGFKTPTLVHPAAVVSLSASIGENSHILAGAVIGSQAKIGEASIINTNASVDHECGLAAGVHIAPGVTLCGCVSVGENTFVGAGSVVLPRVKIGANSIIGAGSVVTRDIPDRVIAFGNPARIIRAL